MKNQETKNRNCSREIVRMAKQSGWLTCKESKAEFVPAVPRENIKLSIGFMPKVVSLQSECVTTRAALQKTFNFHLLSLSRKFD